MKELKHEYPGGWKQADDNRYQYVRKVGPLAYELIEYTTHDPETELFNVITDTICLTDVSKESLESCLGYYHYDGYVALVKEYGDMAGQVAAECLFESDNNYRDNAICEAVSEDEAIEAIERYILEHSEPAAPIIITVEALAAKAAKLIVGHQLTFYTEEDGDAYGIARIKHFDAEMLILNYYGGGCPYIIDLEWAQDTDLIPAILHGLKDYCEYHAIATIYMHKGV